MTREEAIRVLFAIKDELMERHFSYKEHPSMPITAIDMAIESLHREEAEANGYCHRIIPKEYVKNDAMQKLREMPRYLNGVKEKQITKISAEQGWIPFTRRPMTEEEQKDYPNCTFMFDCVLPDDGDEILVSNGRFVWMDVFCNDIDGCYLDSGDDIDEDMAWMPLPKPYRDESEVEE